MSERSSYSSEQMYAIAFMGAGAAVAAFMQANPQAQAPREGEIVEAVDRVLAAFGLDLVEVEGEHG